MSQVGAPGLTPANSSSGASADAQAKAQEVVGRAQEQAQNAAGQAQDRAREQINQGSTRAGEQIHGHASDLRSVSDALRDQGKDRPARAVDRVAGYAEQAGTYLQDKDADSMLSDAEDFGRRKPAVVAAGALAVGFVAARFLKASSSRRYASRATSPRGSSSAGVPPAPVVGRLDGSGDQTFQSPPRPGF